VYALRTVCIKFKDGAQRGLAGGFIQPGATGRLLDIELSRLAASADQHPQSDLAFFVHVFGNKQTVRPGRLHIVDARYGLGQGRRSRAGTLVHRQFPDPVVCSATRFHANQARLDPDENVHISARRSCLRKHGLP
jgi:hypothetical protein